MTVDDIYYACVTNFSCITSLCKRHSENIHSDMWTPSKQLVKCFFHIREAWAFLDVIITTVKCRYDTVAPRMHSFVSRFIFSSTALFPTVVHSLDISIFHIIISALFDIRELVSVVERCENHSTVHLYSIHTVFPHRRSWIFNWRPTRKY